MSKGNTISKSRSYAYYCMTIFAAVNKNTVMKDFAVLQLKAPHYGDLVVYSHK